MILAAVAAVIPAHAAETLAPVEIAEWNVPYPDSRPRDPFAVSAREVWFAGQRGHYLGRLDPETGTFFRRELPDRPGPHNLIVGADGIVWYAGNLKGYIGRYDPRTDEIEHIPMPDPAARDPHTLVFDAGERHIWFTLQGANMVGRLRLSDRAVDLIHVPTLRARPYGIKIGPDGTVWVALFGTSKLASIDPETLLLTEHSLPDTGARPRRLEVLDDGQIYYVDYARGMLGHYDPQTAEVEEWAMPSGAGARPYGMAHDAAGRIWFVETGVDPNLFVGFDPTQKKFFSITPIASGGGAVRHMHYHAPTGTVWFGTDANTIGRAQVMAP
ncbi:MAG: lyase [Alphaproteobacteria bacterium]|nr:MAG: lyase [Alphaproteobacteria bacterium]